MSTISAKLQLSLQFYLYVKQLKSKENHKNIAVFSNPRGGSTWLAKSLNATPKSAIVWEPLFKPKKFKINTFNPFSYQELHELGLGWHQHIPENDTEWKEVFLFFDRLFSKEIKNVKLYRFNNLKTLPDANTFIYKFCFGNLILPYLVNNFNIKSIFMLRHPCSVVASQMNHGWNFLQQDATFQVPEMRHNQIYKKYESILSEIKYPEENLAAKWCITNDYIIRHPENNKKWTTLAYEDLYLRKDEILKEVYQKLDLEWSQDVIKELNKKSFTSNANTKSYVGKTEQLEVWKKRLSVAQIDRIFGILDKFGVDYYTEKPEPNYNLIYNK